MSHSLQGPCPSLPVPPSEVESGLQLGLNVLLPRTGHSRQDSFCLDISLLKTFSLETFLVVQWLKTLSFLLLQGAQVPSLVREQRSPPSFPAWKKQQQNKQKNILVEI